jgi:transposase
MQPRTDRALAEAVRPAAHPRRAGAAGGRHRERVVGELWTLARIATVIERLTGVRHHPAHVWALLRHRLGWSVQRPKRRAAERDQEAIDRWVKEDWPRILQTPNGAKPAWSSSTRPRSA